MREKKGNTHDGLSGRSHSQVSQNQRDLGHPAGYDYRLPLFRRERGRMGHPSFLWDSELRLGMGANPARFGLSSPNLPQRTRKNGAPFISLGFRVALGMGANPAGFGLSSPNLPQRTRKNGPPFVYL